MGFAAARLQSSEILAMELSGPFVLRAVELKTCVALAALMLESVGARVAELLGSFAGLAAVAME